MVQEKFVQVDGLNVRYLTEGSGRDVILLHGASLGSSADVWDGDHEPLASWGLRVTAFDQPSCFGRTDNPLDHSVAYRQRYIFDGDGRLDQ